MSVTQGLGVKIVGSLFVETLKISNVISYSCNEKFAKFNNRAGPNKIMHIGFCPQD